MLFPIAFSCKLLQPNSILLAWPDDWSKNSESGAAFVSIVKGAVQARKAVMVHKTAICYLSLAQPHAITVITEYC
jgi:hypothetical protein